MLVGLDLNLLLHDNLHLLFQSPLLEFLSISATNQKRKLCYGTWGTLSKGNVSILRFVVSDGKRIRLDVFIPVFLLCLKFWGVLGSVINSPMHIIYKMAIRIHWFWSCSVLNSFPFFSFSWRMCFRNRSKLGNPLGKKLWLWLEDQLLDGRLVWWGSLWENFPNFAIIVMIREPQLHTITRR